MAIELRVIPHEMLNSGAYALALHPLDIADRDTRGEKGIFAEILEVAAIHRRAINVHAGPQHEVHAPGTSVAANLGADSLGEFRIPSGCKRDPAGHGCRGSVVAHAEWPIGHLEARKI